MLPVFLTSGRERNTKRKIFILKRYRVRLATWAAVKTDMTSCTQSVLQSGFGFRRGLYPEFSVGNDHTWKYKTDIEIKFS